MCRSSKATILAPKLCDGSQTGNAAMAGQPPIVNPFSYTIRVDLKAERWCYKECTTVDKIEKVDSNQLVFMNSRPAQSEYWVIWANRHTGKLKEDFGCLRCAVRAILSLNAQESELGIERTQAGLARAKAQGVRKGRPMLLTASHQDEIIAKRDAGVSLGTLAKEYGVDRSAIQRVEKRRQPFANGRRP